MKTINIIEDLHKGINLNELAKKPEDYIKVAPKKEEMEDKDNDSNERYGK